VQLVHSEKTPTRISKFPYGPTNPEWVPDLETASTGSEAGEASAHREVQPPLTPDP